jgi:hypothetical protein
MHCYIFEIVRKYAGEEASLRWIDGSLDIFIDVLRGAI